MGAAGHGIHRRWSVRSRSARWRALIGSWATSPTTGAVQIERGSDYYDIIELGGLRGKTPSFWAPRTMASTAAL